MANKTGTALQYLVSFPDPPMLEGLVYKVGILGCADSAVVFKLRADSAQPKILTVYTNPLLRRAREGSGNKVRHFFVMKKLAKSLVILSTQFFSFI